MSRFFLILFFFIFFVNITFSSEENIVFGSQINDEEVRIKQVEQAKANIMLGTDEFYISSHSTKLITGGAMTCSIVVLWDKENRIGCLMHISTNAGKDPEGTRFFNRPDGNLTSKKMVREYLREIFIKMEEQGANLDYVVAGIFGGGTYPLFPYVEVGPRGVWMIKNYLDEKNIPVIVEKTGGKKIYNVSFDTATGEIIVEFGVAVKEENIEELIIEKEEVRHYDLNLVATDESKEIKEFVDQLFEEMKDDHYNNFRFLMGEYSLFFLADQTMFVLPRDLLKLHYLGINFIAIDDNNGGVYQRKMLYEVVSVFFKELANFEENLLPRIISLPNGFEATKIPTGYWINLRELEENENNSH